MVSLTAEQWCSVATDKLLELLAVEGAVTQPEMEAEAVRGGLRLQWTASPSAAPPPVDARHRLLDANVILQQRNTTRGGRTVGVTAGTVLVLLGTSSAAFNLARVHAD